MPTTRCVHAASCITESTYRKYIERHLGCSAVSPPSRRPITRPTERRKRCALARRWRSRREQRGLDRRGASPNNTLRRLSPWVHACRGLVRVISSCWLVPACGHGDRGERSRLSTVSSMDHRMPEPRMMYLVYAAVLHLAVFRLQPGHIGTERGECAAPSANSQHFVHMRSPMSYVLNCVVSHSHLLSKK